MNIIVMSRREVENLPITDNQLGNYVISITNPDSRLAWIQNDESRNLRVQFYDIDRPIADLSGHMFYPMNEEQTAIIAKFVQDNHDKIEKLIVHCEAGISRSAGVAAAIAKYYNGDDAWYFSRYSPNGHCYSKLLEKLHKEDL